MKLIADADTTVNGQNETTNADVFESLRQSIMRAGKPDEAMGWVEVYGVALAIFANDNVKIGT